MILSSRVHKQHSMCFSTLDLWSGSERTHFFEHFVGGGRRLQAPAVLRTTAAIFPIFPFFPIFLSKSFKICHQWILETVPLQLPKQNFILFYFETNHLSTWENNVINRRLYKIFVASVCRYPASRFLVKWKLKYLSKHNKQEARAGDEVQRPATLRTSITF